MKKQITKDEWMQLFGLFTLCRMAINELKQAQKGMEKVLEAEDDYLDHLSDEMWEEIPNFESALKRSGIEVVEEQE